MLAQWLVLSFIVLTVLPTSVTSAPVLYTFENGTFDEEVRFYKIIDSLVPLMNATDYCEESGGYLACITTDFERAYVQTITQSYVSTEPNLTQDRFWLGYTWIVFGGGNPNNATNASTVWALDCGFPLATDEIIERITNNISSALSQFITVSRTRPVQSLVIYANSSWVLRDPTEQNYFICEFEGFCFKDANFCVNGGNCSELAPDVRCDCPPYRMGDRCQHETNECLSNPCIFGTCHDLPRSFSCDCANTGFRGTFCHIEFNECDSNPCLHGTCTDKINAFECDCTNTGFEGARCQTNVNDCVNHTCANGVCVDEVMSFTCNCSGTAYAGANCSEFICDLSTSPCVHGFCEPRPDGYLCSCKAGYDGIDCDEFVGCPHGQVYDGSECFAPHTQERDLFLAFIPIIVILLFCILLCICCSYRAHCYAHIAKRTRNESMNIQHPIDRRNTHFDDVGYYHDDRRHSTIHHSQSNPTSPYLTADEELKSFATRPRSPRMSSSLPVSARHSIRPSSPYSADPDYRNAALNSSPSPRRSSKQTSPALPAQYPAPDAPHGQRKKAAFWSGIPSFFRPKPSAMYEGTESAQTKRLMGYHKQHRQSEVQQPGFLSRFRHQDNPSPSHDTQAVSPPESSSTRREGAVELDFHGGIDADVEVRKQGRLVGATRTAAVSSDSSSQITLRSILRNRSTSDSNITPPLVPLSAVFGENESSYEVTERVQMLHRLDNEPTDIELEVMNSDDTRQLIAQDKSDDSTLSVSDAFEDTNENAEMKNNKQQETQL